MRRKKVFGPPGTGKTTYLISTLKALVGTRADVKDVAYVSHTRAATEEAAERVRNQGNQKLPWFRTIHSACLNRLGAPQVADESHKIEFGKRHGYAITGKLSFDDLLDRESWAADDEYDILFHWRSVAGHRKQSLIEMGADFGITNPLLDPAIYEPFFKHWDAFKSDIGKVDYDDMLRMYVRNPRPLPVRFAFIDEAQDLSKLQWEIIENLFNDVEEMYIAGDDDQAIYAFLGADETGFLRFPADEEIVLSKSYRCGDVIGKYAEQIIASVETRKEKHVAWGGHTSKVEWLSDDITDLPFHQWNGRSVMILAPHRAQVNEIRNRLEQSGIPCSVRGVSLATTPLAMAVRAYLDIQRGTKVRPALMARLLEVAFPASQRLRDQIDRLRASGREDPKLLVDRSDVPDVAWRMSWEVRFSGGQFRQKQIDALERLISTAGLAALGIKPAVDISTMHGSKGREADIVVMVSDVFKSSWQEVLDGKPSASRLAYVAVTRARSQAIILNPRGQMYLKPLVEP